MKTRRWIFWCAASLATTGALADLDVRFDRFKKRTEILAPSMKAAIDATSRSEHIIAQAMTYFPGEKPESSPLTVLVAFRSMSRDGWRFLRCHDVAMLVNGEPMPVRSVKHSGDVVRGAAVLEQVLVTFPWATFQSIAGAQTVEFRICRTELKISPDQLADWRAVVAAGTPK